MKAIKALGAMLLLSTAVFGWPAICIAQGVGTPGASAIAPSQPLPFSHKRHAGNLVIPCTYCHVKPEPGVQMTLPSTAICMSCHASIGNDKPVIKTLSEFSTSGKPIPWVQIYSIPGFVFWSHDVHLQAKVECASCHGDVKQMETMAKVTNVTEMAGCVSCHKQRNAPTGCLVCHETQSSRLLEAPIPSILRRSVHDVGGI